MPRGVVDMTQRVRVGLKPRVDKVETGKIELH